MMPRIRGTRLIPLLFLLVASLWSLQASQALFPFPNHAEEDGLTSTYLLRGNERTPQIGLSTRWSSIGPFPSGMREHQMGSVSALQLHPIANLFDLSDPVLIPSTYGDNASITARCIDSNDLDQQDERDGSVSTKRIRHRFQLSYPKIDWSMIKLSVGWAGLQWEALSVTDLTVQSDETIFLSINIDKAACFAILSEEEYLHYSLESTSFYIQWYNGDMYSYNEELLEKEDGKAPSHILRVAPGHHKLLIKSVYEVRVFGSGYDRGPAIDHTVDIRLIDVRKGEEVTAVICGQYGIVPDVVDGIFAGWGISFALRNNLESWIEVSHIQSIGNSAKYLSLEPTDASIRFAPHQTRPIKAKVKNIELVPEEVHRLMIEFIYWANDSTFSTSKVVVELPLNHIRHLTKEIQAFTSYKYTYLDSDDTLQYAAVVPPRNLNSAFEASRPAIIYLHGAGVDIRNENAQRALLQQEYNWIIHPSGRSPWGLDWQTNLCSPLSALTAFSSNMYGLASDEKRVASKIDTDKILIVGHSNGGQGTLYFASKYPDLSLGAIVGAPYLSLCDYVPFTWQQGRHHNDAALSGILKSSLNLFENNLYASNLAGIPLLFKYGSQDDNVPSWHTKELVSLLKLWNKESYVDKELIKVSEVQGKGHYWEEFMREADVQDELKGALQYLNYPNDFQNTTQLDKFTIHVFNAEDSGSKGGWKITQIELPGRMSRLVVEYLKENRTVVLRSSNTLEISFDMRATSRDVISLEEIEIDGSRFDGIATDKSSTLHFHKTLHGWMKGAIKTEKRSMGPMIRFLSSSGPIKIIIPTQGSQEVTLEYLSIARRFAMDMYLYNRIDSEILYDYEIVHNTSKVTSNVLLLGGPKINLISAKSIARQNLFHFINGSSQFGIQDRHFAKDTTLLSLVPHPFAEVSSNLDNDFPYMQRPLALFLHGTDLSSIERGYKLLPVRTGTMLPEWFIIDQSSEWKAYGGVVGAGWFNHEWGWSESMSYLVQ